MKFGVETCVEHGFIIQLKCLEVVFQIDDHMSSSLYNLCCQISSVTLAVLASPVTYNEDILKQTLLSSMNLFWNEL